MTEPAPALHDRTVAIQKSIETGDRYPLRWFDSRTYVQHNLLLGDGFGPLLAFLDSLPAGTSRVTALRAFTDGDTSVAHLEYHLEPMGHVAGFEVHRWQDDRIVEHWDNLQPVPPQPNRSGRSVLDGPTEVTDRHRTADNKAVVEDFVRTVLIGRHTDAMDQYVDPARYREHHPHRGDDPAELVADLAGDEPRLSYVQLHAVHGEGNFVLTLCEGAVDATPTAFYDLHRVEDGRIVEHWDVVEPIPPRAQWANDNGKF